MTAVCPACGSSAGVGARFCRNCGSALGPQQVSASSGPPADTLFAGAKALSASTRNTPKVGLIALGLLLALVIAAVGVFLLTRRPAAAPPVAAGVGSPPANTAPVTAPGAIDAALVFYRSYLPLAFGEHGPYASDGARKARADLEALKQHALTAAFLARFAKEGEDLDADPITRSQDWDQGWLSTLSGKMLSQTSDAAAVRLSIGVVAHMRLVDGEWRLDDVTETPEQLAVDAANARPSAADFGSWTYAQTLAALIEWANAQTGDMRWSLSELSHCQLRERFGSHLTVGDHAYFTADTEFSVGQLDSGRLPVQEDMTFLNCSAGASCGVLVYSDNRQPPRPSTNVELHYQGGKGPDVIAAMTHLGELCRSGG